MTGLESGINIPAAEKSICRRFLFSNLKYPIALYMAIVKSNYLHLTLIYLIS